MLLSLVALLVVLSVLILVHEFGHFFAAKWVGIQVPRFSLGFGKRLAGFHWGETEFVLSAIPLGGYVKMAGMEDDEAAEVLEGAAPEEPVDPERTFDSKPIWARTVVIIAGVVMNMLFAVFAYSVIALAYGAPRLASRVGGVEPTASAEALAQAGRVPRGALVTAVGGTPVTEWREMTTALMDAPAGPVELRLQDAPPVALTLPADQEERRAVVAALRPPTPPVVGEVEGGSPAYHAGLRPGDRFVEAAGRPVADWSEVMAAIVPSAGRPLALVVERDGARVPLQVVPARVTDRAAVGSLREIGRLGVTNQPPELERRRVGVFESVKIGFDDTVFATRYLLRTLKQLVTGELSARNMGGLLTIGQASGESARLGLEYFLSFLALFSVNLAVLNLLPIPILDGGHLVFLAAEAVRGRPLSINTRIRLSQVGLVIVVGLMLWANGNDVVRWLEKTFGG